MTSLEVFSDWYQFELEVDESCLSSSRVDKEI